MISKTSMFIGSLLAATHPWIIGGCLSPNTVTVNLVNGADHPVDVTLFYDDNQYITEELLEEVGRERQSRVQPGETASFSDDCNSLQAIFIQKAELSIVGTIGPSNSSRVYRDGSDFGCGDTITFTFTQNLLGTELSIAYSQRN